MTTCEKCGKILNGQDNFCPGCGTPVKKKPAAGDGSFVLCSTPQPIFGDYTSPILESKPEPIFSDSSSFMAGYSSRQREKVPEASVEQSAPKVTLPPPVSRPKKEKLPEYQWEDWSEPEPKVSSVQRTLPEISQPAEQYYQEKEEETEDSRAEIEAFLQRKQEEFREKIRQGKQRQSQDALPEFHVSGVAEKGLSLLSYLGFLVVIPIVAGKNSPQVRFHANQGLVLFSASILLTMLEGIITSLLGFSLMFLIGPLLRFVIVFFQIRGIINVLKGSDEKLPVIGKIQILK